MRIVASAETGLHLTLESKQFAAYWQVDRGDVEWHTAIGAYC